MLPPEFGRPQFSADQAAYYFIRIPPVALMMGTLDIDREAAAWLLAVALRMPFDQAVVWLNDVAAALVLGYPLNWVMVAAMTTANHGLIWKRRTHAA